jgi:hypothetical protein
MLVFEISQQAVQINLCRGKGMLSSISLSERKSEMVYDCLFPIMSNFMNNLCFGTDMGFGFRIKIKKYSFFDFYPE